MYTVGAVSPSTRSVTVMNLLYNAEAAHYHSQSLRLANFIQIQKSHFAKLCSLNFITTSSSQTWNHLSLQMPPDPQANSSAWSKPSLRRLLPRASTSAYHARFPRHSSRQMKSIPTCMIGSPRPTTPSRRYRGMRASNSNYHSSCTRI